jgi:hypothetical protein
VIQSFLFLYLIIIIALLVLRFDAPTESSEFEIIWNWVVCDFNGRA